MVTRSNLPANLAGRILEHACASGLSSGAHLAEQHLADTFRVSRTPVRLALRLLEGRGIVESRRSHGFFLLSDPKTVAMEAPVEDPVYMRIAEDRLDGILPDRVSESEMMRRYDITGSQLARLLARMAREGWVERMPGQGWEFQPLLDSPQALEHSYRFRILVEPAALLDPAFHLPIETIDQLEEQQRMLLRDGGAGMSPSTLFELSATFHETIVAGSPNPFLLDAIRRINRLRRLIEYRIGYDGARLATQCRSNLHLLELLRTGDRQAAAEYLRVHLEGARQRKTGGAARKSRAATAR